MSPESLIPASFALELPAVSVAMHLFPRPIVTRLGLLASLTSLPLIVAQDSVSYEYETYGADDESGTPFQTYMSNTNVMPPEMQINRNGTALQDGLVFLGINGLPSSGQNWPAIFGMSLPGCQMLVQPRTRHVALFIY